MSHSVLFSCSLFFDEGREDLVHTMFSLLKPGVCYFFYSSMLLIQVTYFPYSEVRMDFLSTRLTLMLYGRQLLEDSLETVSECYDSIWYETEAAQKLLCILMCNIHIRRFHCAYSQVLRFWKLMHSFLAFLSGNLKITSKISGDSWKHYKRVQMKTGENYQYCFCFP